MDADSLICCVLAVIGHMETTLNAVLAATRGIINELRQRAKPDLIPTPVTLIRFVP